MSLSKIIIGADRLNKLDGTVADIEKLSQQMKNLTEQLPPDAGKNIGIVLEQMKGITSVLNASLAGEETTLTKKLFEALLFVYDFIVCLVSRTWASTPTLAIRLASLLGLTPQKVVAWLTRLLKVDPENVSIQDPEEGAEEAFEFAEMPVEGLIGQGKSFEAVSLSALLVGLVGAVVTNKLPSMKTISNVSTLLRIVDVFPRAFNNATNIAAKLVELMPECVQTWIYWAFPEEWFLDKSKKTEKFFEWAYRVRSYDTLEVRNRMAWDPIIQKAIKEDYELGQRYIVQTAISDVVNSKMHNYLNKNFDLCAKMFAEVEELSNSRGFRIPPYSVALCGKPGQGKSFMASQIPLLLAPEGVPEANLVYCRNPGTAYWDGYTGQFCTILDDWGQSLNATNPEIMDFLLTVSPLRMQLNMADLKDKGKCFTSRLVVSTTNTPYADFSMFIRENLAAWRRRDVLARVIVKPQYLNDKGVVDPRLIPDDNSHYVIEILNPVIPNEAQNSVLDEHGRPLILSYDEFMDYLLVDYHDYVERMRAVETRRVNTIAEFRERFRRRRQPQAEDFHDAQPFVDPVHYEERARAAMVAHRIERAEALRRMDRDFEMRWGQIGRDVVPEDNEAQGKTQEEEEREQRLIAHFAAMPAKDPAIVQAAERAFELEVQQAIERADANYRAATDTKTQRFIFETQKFRENCLKLREKRMQESQFFSWWIGSKLLMGLALGIFGTIVYYIYSSYSCKKNEAEQSGDVVTKKIPIKRVFGQGSEDPNAVDIAKSAIAPYTVILSSVSGSLNAIAVRGKVLLIPSHFFKMRDGTDLPVGSRIKMSGPFEFETDYDPESAVRLGDHDAVLYHFGPRFRSVRDNVSLFVKNEDLPYLNNSPGVMIHFSSTYEAIIYKHITRLQQLTKPSIYTYNDEKYSLQHGFAYNIATERGECGSPIVAFNPRVPRKITGIHVAGSKSESWGFSELITQELLLEGLAALPQQVVGTPFDAQLLPLENAKIIPEGNFSLLGVMKPKDTPRLPTKTDIRPSLLQNAITKTNTQPAALLPSDPRITNGTSPLANGIKKYGVPSQVVDKDVLKRAVEGLKDTINSFPVKGPRRVLTDDEAINGLPIDYFDKMNMDTSAGYPYNMRKPPGAKGKEWLYECKERQYVMKDLDLLNRCVERETRAKYGFRVESVWCDNLKDERRPDEKVATANTRCFVVAPTDYLHVFRKYCLSFAAHFYSMHSRSFTAVGIDPFSYDWTIMMNRLMAKNTKGFAGDYRKFDGRIPPEFIEAAKDIINSWYADSEENQMVRSVLFDELCHTVQQALGTVYMSHQGNPSGCPITSIFNTIVNALYLRYAYLMMATPPHQSIKSYNENVAETIFGDDFVVAPTEEVASWFNMLTYQAFWTARGIEITMPDKLSESVAMTDLCNLSFLKCKTRKVGNLYLAVMDKQTIFEMVNWIRDCDDYRLATEQNANNALRFMFFYGREDFEDLRSKLRNAAKERDIFLDLYDYEHFKVQTEMEPTEMKKTMKTVYARMLRDSEKEDGPSEEIPWATWRGSTPFFKEEHLEAREEYALGTGSHISLRPGSDNRPIKTAPSFRCESLEGFEIPQNTRIAMSKLNKITFEQFIEKQRTFLENAISPEFRDAWMEQALKHQERQLARISYQLLEEEQEYANIPPTADNIAQAWGGMNGIIVDEVDAGMYSVQPIKPYCGRDQAFEPKKELLLQCGKASLRLLGERGTYDVQQRAIQEGNTWVATTLGRILPQELPTDLEVQMEEGAREGVSFLDEEITKGNRQQLTAKTIMADSSKNDKLWNVAEMTERWSLLETFQWTAVPADSVIKRYNVPKDCITSLPVVRAFNSFTYWRGNVRFKFVVNGTKFHLGRLIIFWTPLKSTTEVQDWQEKSQACWTGLQNQQMDANVSNTVEILCPYAHSKNMLNINDIALNDANHGIQGRMGTLSVLVMNELGFATGASTSLDISVYVSFEDTIFSVLRNEANLFATQSEFTEKKRKFIQYCLEKGHDVPKALYQELLEYKDRVMATKTVRQYNAIKPFEEVPRDLEAQMDVGGIIGSVVDAGAGALKEIAREAIPKELSADAFGLVAALDMPNVPERPPVWVRRAIGPMASIVGINNFDKLSLKTDEVAGAGPEHFGTPEDEMSWDFLIKRPILLTRIPWQTTDLENTILATAPIGPMSIYTAGITPVVNSLVPLTNVDYYSNMAEFWKGGWIVKLQIVATQFSSGRLYFGTAIGDRTVPTTRTEIASQYGNIIDIATTREVTFEIPYTARTDKLRVCNGRVSQGPVLNPSGNAVDQDFLNYFTGYWGIAVMNKLVIPSNIPGKVYINISVCGAADYRLYWPRDAGRSIVPCVSGETRRRKKKLPRDLIAQSIETVGTTTEVETQVLLGTAGSNTNVELLGNEITHPKELIKRFSTAYAAYTKLVAGVVSGAGFMERMVTNAHALPVRPLMDTSVTGANLALVPANWLAEIGLAYGGWKGSLNWKILSWPQDNGDNNETESEYQRTIVAHEPTIMQYGEMDFSDVVYATPTAQLQQLFSPLNGQFDTVAGSRVGLMVSDVNAPYLEFETDFANNNIFCYNEPLRGNLQLSEMNAAGMLIVANQRAIPTNIGGNSISDFLVCQAAGDGFRYGLFLGIPLLEYVKYSQLASGGGPAQTWFLDSQPFQPHFVGQELPTDLEAQSGDEHPPKDKVTMNKIVKKMLEAPPAKVYGDSQFIEECKILLSVIQRGERTGAHPTMILNELHQRNAKFRYGIDDERVVGKPPVQYFTATGTATFSVLGSVFYVGTARTKQLAREEASKLAVIDFKAKFLEVVTFEHERGEWLRTRWEAQSERAVIIGKAFNEAVKADMKARPEATVEEHLGVAREAARKVRFATCIKDGKTIRIADLKEAIEAALPRLSGSEVDIVGTKYGQFCRTLEIKPQVGVEFAKIKRLEACNIGYVLMYRPSTQTFFWKNEVDRDADWVPLFDFGRTGRNVGLRTADASRLFYHWCQDNSYCPQ